MNIPRNLDPLHTHTSLLDRHIHPLLLPMSGSHPDYWILSKSKYLQNELKKHFEARFQNKYLPSQTPPAKMAELIGCCARKLNVSELLEQYIQQNAIPNSIYLDLFAWILGEEPACVIFNRYRKESIIFLPNHCYDTVTEHIAEFFRFASFVVMPDINGLIIHSSGIVDMGGALLFIGPSGCGKTTIARLAGNRLILGEDAIIIQKGSEGFYAFFSPLIDSFSLRSSVISDMAKVKGIFLPVKDTNDYLVPVTFVEALRTAMNNIMAWGYFYPQYHRHSFCFLSELLSHVPLYELHFRKSPNYLKTIKSEIESIDE
jgi:hypothetical protein